MKNLKRISFATLSVLMVGMNSLSFAASDIAGHWAEYELKQMQSQGIIAGYEDGSIKPNNAITRAEFAKVINRYFNLTNKSDIKFTDVNSSDWYYEDLKIAVGNGYMGGYEDNTFKPNEPITREEAMKAICTLTDMSDNQTDKLANFADSSAVSDWAKPYVEGAIENGMIKGDTNNKINPKGNITRAEMVAMVSRISKDSANPKPPTTNQGGQTQGSENGQKPGRPGGLVQEDKVDTSNITHKYLDVAYASDSETQKIDIYLPEDIETSEPVPVVFYVHGGGFMMGDKSSGVLESVLTGLEKGYAVVSVNYRLSGEAIFPAAVNDVQAAIKYVRENASKYNVDPEKFAVWGESAGGNIASMVGTTGEGDTKVSAVVDWFGPIDFVNMDAQFEALGLEPKMGNTLRPDSPESKYLGGDLSTEEYQQVAQKANPMNFIDENDAAFLIQHGTADTNVPITQSVNLYNKLVEVLGEDKVTFTQFEGAGHGNFGAFNPFETEENVEYVYEFLDKVLK